MSGKMMRRFLALGAIFVLQGAMYLGISLEERLPAAIPLDSFPARLSNWTMTGEQELDAPTQALLRPDLSVMRGYQDDTGTAAGLFVGYFKSTQANHPAPHSPTVCLPGSGWKEVYQKQLDERSKSGNPFRLNEYVLHKGGERLVVYYWYQNSRRTWAQEVWAKIYMLPDFIQTKRSDVAFVRLTIQTDENSYANALVKAKGLAMNVENAMSEMFVSTIQK